MLWVFLLILQTEALKPSLNVALKSSELSAIKNVLVREFSDKLKNITLPDFTKDYFVVKITGRNIKAHISPFNESQIEIKLVEDTNQITVKGKGLNFNGEMDLTTKFLFIKHKNRGTIKVSDTGFTAKMRILRNGERLKVVVEELSISTSRNKFDIAIKGNSFDSILNFFFKIIQFIFFNSIIDLVNSIGKEIIQGILDKALSTYRNDIELFPGVFTKFIVTSVNITKNGYLPISLFVYGHNRTHDKEPKELPPDLPNGSPTCDKGFQLFLSDFILKTILKASYEEGQLKFYSEMNVFNFALEISCNASSLPSIELKSNIEAKGTIICKAKVKSAELDINMIVSFEADVSSKLKEDIKEAKLYVDIETILIEKLRVIEGKDIDEKKLKDMMNSLINDFREEFNKSVKKDGIELPVIKHLDLSDIEESIIQDYIFFCGSLKMG